jgi:hypothetical protein
VDGYNSLLERAKARLAAISSKDKKDSLPSSHRLSLLNPLPSNIRSLNAKGADALDKSKIADGFAVPGRLSSRFAESNSTSTRNVTLRSRSSDRRASSGSASMEKKDSSSVATIRARLNSPSLPKNEGQKSPPGLHLGWTTAPPLTSPSVSPVASSSSASAKLQCRNLTNSLDIILQRLHAVCLILFQTNFPPHFLFAFADGLG